MIIDNGGTATLEIAGVFSGVAGFSRGKVAFIPNQAGKAPEMARGGILNGQPVRLDIAREGDGPIYSAVVSTRA